MVTLDHAFISPTIDDTWSMLLDLERLVPCVQGGTVLEKTGPEAVRAEIKVKMGAMSMKFIGTVSVVEQDRESHRAVLQVKSRETGGQGQANADVVFTLGDDGGNVHTVAQITGKPASMGEGVVTTVLDALIKDFTEKVSAALAGRLDAHATAAE